MIAPVILVEATPRGASDGAPMGVRLAGGGAVVPYFYGGEHYRAGVTGLPKTSASLDFDGQQLGGGGVGQTLEIAWAPATGVALDELSAMFWKDAPITVRVGPEGDAVPPVVTTGLVLENAVEEGVLRIALADQGADLKRPLLVDRYAGTGGIEGPAEWEGQIKTRAWGRCFNVPGRCIDQATQIWSFGDPIRGWLSFDQVRDTGVYAQLADLPVLDWQGSAPATFAALQGVDAPDGGGVRCPSIACVKWWMKPAGDLHADIRGEADGGYVETAAEIAARIVAARSTLGFAGGAVASAAAARPAPFGWRVDSDTSTAASELSELLAGVSLSWLIVDGTITFRSWEWTPAVRAARSETVKRRQIYAPVTTRKLGYRRNWDPMARGELAAAVLAADAAKTADWPDVADPLGTKPTDNADVTSENTSKDTEAVGGRPAEDVLAQIDTFDQVIVPAINVQIGAANAQIAAANTQIGAADTRITAARAAADTAKARADAAFGEIGAQATRLDERIDNVAASGGYDDTSIYAEVGRVDSTAIGRDAALSQSIQTVSASVTTADSSLRALVQTKEQAAVGRETAISQRIDAIVAESGDGGTDIYARSEITRVEQASIGRDDALGSRVDSVSAAIGTAVNAKAQEITTAYTQADTALAGRTTALETASAATSARVGTVEAAVSDGRFATAQRAATLEARADGADARLAGTAASGLGARLATVETATTDGRFATAQRATNLEARADDAAAKLDGATASGLGARLSSVETATTDGRFATAQRASNIEAAAGQLAARIASTEAAVTDGRFATSSRVDQVSAMAAGAAASAGTSAQAIADVQTGLAGARVVLSAVSAGGVAELEVHSDSETGAGVRLKGNVEFAGKLNVGTNKIGAHTEIDDMGFRIYDANGVNRIFLGLRP